MIEYSHGSTFFCLPGSKAVQCFGGCLWLNLQAKERNLLCATCQIKGIISCLPEDWESFSKYYTVEPPFHVPQFNVFPHFTFNFNDSKLIISVKLLIFQIFISLVFESAASQRRLKWRFYCFWSREWIMSKDNTPITKLLCMRLL
jgi:hypothetical protein